MKALWLLTKKNLKLLLRAKSSALIVIFAPLLIILILGLSYNTSAPYGLTVGVFSPVFTEESEAFMQVLKSDQFEIQKYETTVDDCLDDLKKSTTHACIEIPESFEVQANEGQKEVVFYIDPSRVNLVWMIQESLKSKFNIKSQQISQELTEEILNRLIETREKLDQNRQNLVSIKDKTSSASTTFESAQNDLESINITDPETRYDTNDLDKLDNDISKIKQDVEAALNKVESVNMTEADKSNIITSLNNAQSKLDGLLGAGNATNQTNQTKVADIVSLFDSIETDLTSAVTAVSSTTTNLATVTTTLKQIIANTDSLLSAVDEIQKNLEAQKITDVKAITSPLTTRIVNVGPQQNYLNFLFPALLVLVVMFSTLLLGTAIVMMEKSSPAYVRNHFVPVKKHTFMFSMYLTNLVILLIEIIVILGLALFFLPDTLTLMPGVALVLIVGGSVFTFLGMGLGYLFKSEQTGILAATSLGSLFVLVSGIILPLEGASAFLQETARFSPFVIAEKLVRQIFIQNIPLSDVWFDLVILVGYAVALMLFIIAAVSLSTSFSNQRFLKNFHVKHRQNDKKETKKE